MKSDETRCKKLHVGRDISWICFNQRILLEAAHPEVPLPEQLIFLGICSNDLDKFLRAHMTTLNRIVEYGDKNIHKERGTVARTLKRIDKLHSQYYRQSEEISTSITEKLKQEDTHVIKDTELTPEQELPTTSLYRNRLDDSIGPLFPDKTSRQPDDQTDEGIYLAIHPQRKDGEGGVETGDYTIIELPTNEFGRFIHLSDSDSKMYLMFLDDVIRYCLPMVLINMNYTDREACTFEFIKDAEMEIDSGLHTGVLQRISKRVESRRRGELIRFVYDQQMPEDLLRKLTGHLNADKSNTHVAGGRYHDFKDLMELPNRECTDLKHPIWPPISKQEPNGEESILELIREQDYSLHHPYQSFNAVIHVLHEATISKEVGSIKMTLYRLAKDSKVVKALICTTQNGEKITVIVELLARFDEASNINQSKCMQDAGIKMIFGVEGLKTYSKLIYIGIRFGDLACISTGNFRERNARMYTDFTIMTIHRSIVHEVNSVFDFIEKPYLPANFKGLLVSPSDMHKRSVALIGKEVKNKQQEKETYILAKVNYITDRTLVQKFYETSTAGVQIDLVVWGNYSLVTGTSRISDNIRTNGIIGCYLGHSHIFIFANGREEKCHVGSVSWMPHNLDNHIEMLVPIYNKAIQDELKKVVYHRLRDTAKGRITDSSGENRIWEENGIPFRSQEELYKYCKELERRG